LILILILEATGLSYSTNLIYSLSYKTVVAVQARNLDNFVGKSILFVHERG